MVRHLPTMPSAKAAPVAETAKSASNSFFMIFSFINGWFLLRSAGALFCSCLAAAEQVHYNRVKPFWAQSRFLEQKFYRCAASMVYWVGFTCFDVAAD